MSNYRTTPLDEAIYRVLVERERQDELVAAGKFLPHETNTDLNWAAVLTEEYLELIREVNDAPPGETTQALLEELVQVMAVGLVWLEHRLQRVCDDDSEGAVAVGLHVSLARDEAKPTG